MSKNSSFFAAVFLSTSLVGCAGSLPPLGPSLVTIHFKADQALKRDCPVAVTVEPLKQCGSFFGKQADCLQTQPAQQVVFAAQQDGPPVGDGVLEFSVDFDPFKRGNNLFRGDKNHKLELPLDPRSPPKAYTYNVFSGDCPVLDPQIIIRK